MRSTCLFRWALWASHPTSTTLNCKSTDALDHEHEGQGGGESEVEGVGGDEVPDVGEGDGVVQPQQERCGEVLLV